MQVQVVKSRVNCYDQRRTAMKMRLITINIYSGKIFIGFLKQME